MQRDMPLPRIQSAQGWGGSQGAGPRSLVVVSGGETPDTGCRGRVPCRTGFCLGKIPKCALLTSFDGMAGSVVQVGARILRRRFFVRGGKVALQVGTEDSDSSHDAKLIRRM